MEGEECTRACSDVLQQDGRVLDDVDPKRCRTSGPRHDVPVFAVGV